jgi:carboxyl-terminal processing protease
MKKQYLLIRFSLLFVTLVSCAHKSSTTTSAASEQEQKANTESVGDLNLMLKDLWIIAKSSIYPQTLEKKFFTDQALEKLERMASQSNDVYDLAPEVNLFLDKLNVSHTRFYTDRDIEFYFFRSLFTTRDLDKPAIFHIGAEYEPTGKGYLIRNVLEGYTAQRVGLKRGDLVFAIDEPSESFHPVLSFKNFGSKERILFIRRGKQTLKIKLAPVFSGIHRAYIEATVKSAKVLSSNGKRIGYIHLWTGTHEDSIRALHESVKKLKDTDALILDLRDGFGGAWWGHLDPFFKDSKNYFKATWIDREGKRSEMLPTLKENTDVYSKPMIVLINEGVRSGKEALAFQFKKTKRALLIGTRTAGFFVAGAAHFRDSALNYFLYLSSKGLLLDGVDLEGRGVDPDIIIEYPLSSPESGDPQLSEALLRLSKE